MPHHYSPHPPAPSLRCFVAVLLRRHSTRLCNAQTASTPLTGRVTGTKLYPLANTNAISRARGRRQAAGRRCSDVRERDMARLVAVALRKVSEMKEKMRPFLAIAVFSVLLLAVA